MFTITDVHIGTAQPVPPLLAEPNGAGARRERYLQVSYMSQHDRSTNASPTRPRARAVRRDQVEFE
jgi:hypothetical protein